MTTLANPLVSVQELAAAVDAASACAAAAAANGSDPSSVSAAQAAPTLLDVRWFLTAPRPADADPGSAPAPAPVPPRPSGLDAYLAGHLPGARFVDLDTDLAGPVGPGTGRHPLPEPEAFQAAMRAAGVGDGRPVVVYDAADSTAAARAWWLLRYFGHQDVRVLDGGYAAWAAAGQPVSAPLPDPTAAGQGEPGDFTARPGHLPTLDAAAAAQLARDGVLLDARAAARYRGEVEPIDPVAGHIPGALSAPTSANVTESGHFQPADKLVARFAGLFPREGAFIPEVGVYCGSGVTAAHQTLALTVAGIPAALYVGSWSEWVADPTRPVETGPGPARIEG
ncbi:MAG TPA: sulfurtransferase [Actinocrinis sp.]|nr:sulfurtransferase [Actinocrinis sp.]